jgi:hypothetical protein
VTNYVLTDHPLRQDFAKRAGFIEVTTPLAASTRWPLRPRVRVWRWASPFVASTSGIDRQEKLAGGQARYRAGRLRSRRRWWPAWNLKGIDLCCQRIHKFSKKMNHGLPNAAQPQPKFNCGSPVFARGYAVAGAD